MAEEFWDGLEEEELIALQEFRRLLRLNNDQISIWGVRLQPDLDDGGRTDVILLKFLRARDLKVYQAYEMLSRTILWRTQFGIDELVNFADEDDSLRNLLDSVCFVHGRDREGYPVCYNVFRHFEYEHVYDKLFSSEANIQRLLTWKILSVEKMVRKLDFRVGKISTIVHVNDLKNCPGPEKKGFMMATYRAVQLLRDNYPELVERQIFINVPWRYLAIKRIINPFQTRKKKNKFVFAGPSKSACTLLKYIGVDYIPSRRECLTERDQFEASSAVLKASSVVFTLISSWHLS
ncbi:PATL5 [Linum grandiflorum]